MGEPDRSVGPPTACKRPPWGWGRKFSPAERVILFTQQRDQEMGQMLGMGASAAERPDPRDMTGQYNTTLTPDEEKRYQSWAKAQPRGRPDVYDYDQRGFYREGGKVDMQTGHGPDTHKKPNHPTFSSDSKYHGVQGYQGGTWGTSPTTGGETFTAGATNKKFWSREDLQDYFDKSEPGIELIY